MSIQVDGDNVSAIIRCNNEERWIGYSIQSVLDILSNPEIIIIDNQSEDESMDIVRMFEKWHDIKVLSIEDYSPGKALNYGISKSTYDNILVMSAHCCLTKFSIDINALDQYAAIFGKQIPFYKGRKINRRYVWSHFVDHDIENMWSKIENRYFLHNALCLYNKEFLKENPFDEQLYGKEDRYWAIDIIEKGHKTLYSPLLECNHHWTTGGATWKGIG